MNIFIYSHMHIIVDFVMVYLSHIIGDLRFQKSICFQVVRENIIESSFEIFTDLFIQIVVEIIPIDPFVYQILLVFYAFMRVRCKSFQKSVRSSKFIDISKSCNRSCRECCRIWCLIWHPIYIPDSLIEVFFLIFVEVV